MPVRIRLKRMGTRRKARYRIVAADARSPRDGRFIEALGHYDPLTEPATVEIDKDKALEWLKRGAEMTPTVRSLFSKKGILKDFEALRGKQGGEGA